MARLSPPKKNFSAYSASERVRFEIYKQDIDITTLSKLSGVSRSTVYSFVYNGIDISSVRCAKICGVLGISMDYVFGLERKKNG